MAGTVSTSSLALFLIVATTFSALFLAELGAWLCSPLTGSSWSPTVLALAEHVRRQHCQNSHPSFPFQYLKYLSSTEQCSSSFLGFNKFTIHGASCGACDKGLPFYTIPAHPNLFATLADPHSLPSSQIPTPSEQCNSTGPSTVHYMDSEHNVQITSCPPGEIQSKPHLPLQPQTFT